MEKQAKTIRHQKLPPTILSAATTKSSVQTRNQINKAGKIPSWKISSLTSWTADKYSNRLEASREIQLKVNLKTTLLKFNLN